MDNKQKFDKLVEEGNKAMKNHKTFKKFYEKIKKESEKEMQKIFQNTNKEIKTEKSLKSNVLEISRKTIINMMTEEEKEVFQKYENTFPFPVKSFLEEIGVKFTVNKGEVFKMEGSIKNDQLYIEYIWTDGIENTTNSCLIAVFINYIILRFFEESQEVEKETIKLLTCEFLMPREKIWEVLSNYFDIPQHFIYSYFDNIVEDIIYRKIGKSFLSTTIH